MWVRVCVFARYLCTPCVLKTGKQEGWSMHSISTNDVCFFFLPVDTEQAFHIISGLSHYIVGYSET